MLTRYSSSTLQTYVEVIVIKGVSVFLAVLALPLAGCATTQSGGVTASARNPLTPDIRVDERVELVAIIYRLAGAQEYEGRQVAVYADAIEAHFGSFRDHPAVLAVKQLRQQRGLSHNTAAEIAVHMTPFPDLRPRRDLRGSQLEPRWTPQNPEAALDFIEKVRSFAVDTNAAAFFAQQRPLYAIIERRVRSVIEDEADLRWVQDFFGSNAGERFIVAPAMGNGNVFYGVRYYGTAGERESYAVMAIGGTDEDGMPAFSVSNVGTLVHELFGHSYINPIINERYDELRPAGELLLQTFGDQMAPQGYRDGANIIQESLIRAMVARYKRARVGEAAAGSELERQRRRGFAYIDDLYELLGTYEQNRSRYRTFRDFFPAIRDHFSRLPERLPAAIAIYDALRPTVIEAMPAQGSENVDPSTTAITLRFSRRMAQRWGILTDPARPETKVDLTGINLDETRTVLTIGIKLEPNRRYALPLVTGPTGMGAEDGVLLKPYTINFTTGPARRPK
jgi:hypothetical protein